MGKRKAGVLTHLLLSDSIPRLCILLLSSPRQSCYHVPTVPPDPQLWYCDLCRYVRWSRFCTKGPTRDRSFHVPEVICQLCGQNNRIKGAFIEVVAVSATGCVAKSRMQFVHKLCALAAQPYVKFIAGTDRQKVLGPIPDLPPATNACQVKREAG